MVGPVEQLLFERWRRAEIRQGKGTRYWGGGNWEGGGGGDIPTSVPMKRREQSVAAGRGEGDEGRAAEARREEGRGEQGGKGGGGGGDGVRKDQRGVGNHLKGDKGW